MGLEVNRHQKFCLFTRLFYTRNYYTRDIKLLIYQTEKILIEIAAILAMSMIFVSCAPPQTWDDGNVMVQYTCLVKIILSYWYALVTKLTIRSA